MPIVSLPFLDSFVLQVDYQHATMLLRLFHGRASKLI
jgi:hypothetical protein